MDLIEATEIALNKIQKLEPDHGSKIIGNILVQDHGDNEILRLAFASDTLIQSHLNNALTKPSNNSNTVSDPIAPTCNNPFFTPPIREPQLALGSPNRVLGSCFGSFAYSNSMLDPQNKSRLLSLEADYESFYSDSPVGNLRRPRVSGFPFKTCHYFNKGYCKNGSECKFYHGTMIPDIFSQMFVTKPNEFVHEEQMYSPRSLEKLEMEITELLESRRGNPVSIAALPLMYQEKYGKNLQAAGYLTESQRHGKAGYSLTKLLARLKNSVRLIDRPHGQHDIVLVEDAAKYMEFRIERNDPGPIVSGSRQIYLTFPAESTFSEHDVAGYFSTYGAVEDVRIPGQPKRMFGFVTFTSSETVKQILGKGNPHFVCGARVLVKPYREKPKNVNRDCGERLPPMQPEESPPMHYSSLRPGPTESETLMRMMLRRQILEEQEKGLSGHHYAGLQLARRLPSIHPFPNKPTPTVQVDDFAYLLDDLNIDNIRYSDTQILNLLNGSFASPASRNTPQGT